MDTSGMTPLGILYVAIALILLGGFVALVFFLGKLIKEKAKTSAVWGAIDQLWILFQGAVVHAEQEIRPTIQKSLADGKLTPEEGRMIRDQVIAIAKAECAGAIDVLKKKFGWGDTAIGMLLVSMVEKALSFSQGAGASSPPTPAAPVVAAVVTRPSKP